MRTDIHRPSVIVPADYRFVEYEYLGPDDPECLIARREFGFYKRPTKPKFVQRVSVETTGEDGFRASTESAAS